MAMFCNFGRTVEIKTSPFLITCCALEGASSVSYRTLPSETVVRKINSVPLAFVVVFHTYFYLLRKKIKGREVGCW